MVQAADLMIIFSNSLGKFGEGKNLSHIQHNAITFPEEKDVIEQDASGAGSLHVLWVRMPTKCFTYL